MQIKNERIGTIFLWCAVLIWTLLLFYFSSQNADDSAFISMKVTGSLLDILSFLPFDAEQIHNLVRKIAHFCFFGLEGFLLGLAMMRSLPKRQMGIAPAVLACAVLAGLNEYSQMFAEGRSCELRDVFIDLAGALVGIMAGALLLYILEQRRRKNVIIS